MNKTRSLFLFIPVFLTVMTYTGHEAAAEISQQRRSIEERKRASLDAKEGRNFWDTGRIHYQYGAWINYRYNDYDEDDNDETSRDILDESFDFDTRIWLQLTLKPPEDADYQNEHTFYVRLKNLYINRLPDDLAGGEDNDGPHVDYAYVVLDLRPVVIEAGRRYFKVGRGIAYSDVNDGIQMNYHRPNWNIGAFVSHTLPHGDNIDASVPGFDKGSDRYFIGTGVGYAGFDGHQLYGYTLVQRDFSDERPNAPLQDYTYDSEYIGIGSLGTLRTGWHYWLELIKEYGESRIFASNAKADVDAWAANLGIERKMRVYGKPAFSFEYAYGSGDSDRTSVTDTESGNTSGHDENFLYFGYLPTGYALAPRLSNIHMYRIGVSGRPFEHISWLKDMRWAVDYYLYHKDQSRGGISDPEANANTKDIGREVDITVDWQIFSDLNLTVEYGYFMPDDAYVSSADDSEQYFATSLTFTF